LVDNYGDESIYEKQYIRDYTDAEVIYEAVNDSEAVDDTYVPFDDTGITGLASPDTLPQGSGWKMSRWISVLPDNFYKIEGININNFEGKAIIFHQIYQPLPTWGLVFGRSYTSNKRTADKYSVDGEGFVLTGNKEIKVQSFGNYDMKIVIKTANDSTVCPIVIKKWNGKYKSTYHLRKKRIDLSNLTWVAIGDSVTWLNGHTWGSGNDGIGMTKGYQDVVSEKIKFKNVISYGANGHCLPLVNGMDSILTYRSMYEKGDIYTIMLGINHCKDIADNLLGTMDDFDNNTGINTLYGAWRVCLDYIYSTNPKAKIFICTEHQFGAAETYDGNKSPEGYDAVQNVSYIIAKKMHIPVIDLYNESGINSMNLSQFTYDNCHPNDEGYKLIGNIIASKFIKHLT
jgi:lysophospholipase L1-like esterase